MSTPTDYHDTVSTTLDRDESTGIYTTTYDWAELDPSTAIMEAVSAVEGTTPVELDPLDEVADADAIDALLAARDAGDADLSVSFRYGPVRVSARRNGTIRLRPVDERTVE